MPGPIGQIGLFTIASGQTVSAAVDLYDGVLMALQMPSAFTGTGVSFQASNKLDGTYNAVKDFTTGIAVAGVVAASGYYPLVPATLSGLRYVKLVSNGAEGADRTVIAMGRQLL